MQTMAIISRPADPTGALPVQDTLERLAGDFPGLIIQAGTLASFADVEGIFGATPAAPRLVAGRKILADAAGDGALLAAVRAETEGVLGLGGGGRLLELPGARPVPGVGIQAHETRYVETHVAEGGAVLAVASLALAEGLARPGALFRKLAGFADSRPASWRFEALIRHEAAGEPAAEAAPDSDVFVSLAQRFLTFVKPLAATLGGGINLRPAPGGVSFAIHSDRRAEEQAERFMTLGGGAGPELWLSA